MRNLAPFPAVAYQGKITSSAFKWRGVSGQLIPLIVSWATYLFNGQPAGSGNPNCTVLVSFNLPPSIAPQGWSPRSVYIDNDGVDFPVYVQALDTGYIAACPPNTSGWFPFYSNARSSVIRISGIGITNESILNGQMTGLFFTDVFVEPAVNSELPQSAALFKASQQTGTGTSHIGTGTVQNSLLGIPTLGDQVGYTPQQLATGTPNFPLPALGPFPGQFITFKHICISVDGMAADNATDIAAATTQLVDENAHIYFQASSAWLGNAQLHPTQIILEYDGNIKIDANHSFALSTPSTEFVGKGNHNWSYTYSIGPF